MSENQDFVEMFEEVVTETIGDAVSGVTETIGHAVSGLGDAIANLGEAVIPGPAGDEVRDPLVDDFTEYDLDGSLDPAVPDIPDPAQEPLPPEIEAITGDPATWGMDAPEPLPPEIEAITGDPATWGMDAPEPIPGGAGADDSIVSENSGPDNEGSPTSDNPWVGVDPQEMSDINKEMHDTHMSVIRNITA